MVKTLNLANKNKEVVGVTLTHTAVSTFGNDFILYDLELELPDIPKASLSGRVIDI
jgi:hypothetical protein